MMAANIRFEDWEAKRMQDPEFRAVVEELEPAYQVARLRIMQGLTQKELARLVGTKQSSISRLESGDSQPSLSFLRRVVEVLGGRLEIRIIASEKAELREIEKMPETIEYYMNLPYRVEIYPEEDGSGFTAKIPDLPGCITFADTLDELWDMITEAKELWFKVALADGDHIPKPLPVEIEKYSGKFVD